MKDQRLTLRLGLDARVRLQALAHDYGLSESAFVLRLIDRAVDPVPIPAVGNGSGAQKVTRAERLYVRLYREDRQLLAARAASRGIPSATYLSVLARCHLRQLAPLPEHELREFRQCVAQLSAIGRNLNQVARRMNQDGVVASISRADLAFFLKTCTHAVTYFKSIVKANKHSWEVGYETRDC